MYAHWCFFLVYLLIILIWYHEQYLFVFLQVLFKLIDSSGMKLIIHYTVVHLLALQQIMAYYHHRFTFSIS